jgi:hypothetical protein
MCRRRRVKALYALRSSEEISQDTAEQPYTRMIEGAPLQRKADKRTCDSLVCAFKISLRCLLPTLSGVDEPEAGYVMPLAYAGTCNLVRLLQAMNQRSAVDTSVLHKSSCKSRTEANQRVHELKHGVVQE